MKYLKRLLLLMLGIVIGCSGCTGEKNITAEKNKNVQQNKQRQSILNDSEMLAEGYRDIYEDAVKAKEANSLEVKQKIVNYFGDKGLAAIDIQNQLDMVHAEQVETFCMKAEKKQTAKVVIFTVNDDAGFVRYDLKTSNGEIDAAVSSCVWIKGIPQADYYHEFRVYTWKYTGNGYFFIEEYHMPGYDGAAGQVGFRVKPLNLTCRELNRKYVLPIGYELNSMLITDWDEHDYSNLNFYDVYDLMYRLKNGRNIANGLYKEGVEYRISKQNFEDPILTYLPISSDTLETSAVYDTESQTYSYRSRGLYDCEFPYEPYPEVVDYEEQPDGTIKLTVQAVWIREEMDCAVCSELTVRELADGRFQYISNHIIRKQGTIEPKWHRERLSTDKWNEYYKKE